MSDKYDYIIVGAGSAGCVLANRLSVDASTRVLLIEAGGRDNAFFIQMPGGYGKVIGDPRYDWCYSSGPEPNLGGREIFTPRGKVLGGSSSINGMAWVRGHREDFESWRQQGNDGWAWSDVLPIFKRIENYHGTLSAVRSEEGVMHVTELEPHPLSRRIIEASVQAGLPRGSDYNDGDPNGLCILQMNKWKGRRFSSSAAYLRPALKRRNLEVLIGAEVERVLFTGRAAAGVELRRNGRLERRDATIEVILAAGAINSPKLLELSGVGDSTRLQSLSIPVVADLRAVGENLQDHFNIGLQMKLRNVGSLNEQMQGWRLMMHGARYLMTKTGILANSPAQVTGYARVMDGAASADIQLWGIPATVVVKRGTRNENKMVMDSQPGVTLSFCQNRPHSAGSTHIRSEGSQNVPAILFNYLDDEHDRAVVTRGLRLCRRILEQPAFDDCRDGPAGPDEAFQSDNSLLEYARATGRSSYHLAGTCRMGRAEGSVVDSQLRVQGLDCLRVIDSSVMPSIVSANTHAATVMIAEKGSDLVLEARRRALTA